ncbi:nuclear transcription factor Y subunit beta isoform X5 [Anopheles aquasalis]|uniref:nuclear transcription factor Y subunit beta isoform X5 n=1 Tax=Anopheles aquasalis TaxID=42839 RepID=UPI00215A0E07|nr:nuclear transcription factor Y subunit beta isoform X5 [Anopheles aquasalis]
MEGLKRVAWPPPADAVEYEPHPSQQKQPVGQQFAPQQQQQQQQQQQFYQQTIPQQQQPHPTYQPANAHQQQRPVERIVPIQRATSIHSPLATPTKSPVNQPKYPAYPQQQQPGGPVNRAPYYPQQQQQQRAGYGGSPSPRSPGIPVGSPRSPGTTLNASPRGWSHVASPVPTYRPSPQQHQQQQFSSPSPSSPSAPFYQQSAVQQHQQPHRPGYQVFVPPPLVAQPVQPAFAHGGAGGGGGGAPWYGARKPEDQQQQQPLAAQYPNQSQQPYTYQPQATQAFQPLTPQQQSQAAVTAPYQPIQPQQYHQQQQQQQQQLPPTLVTTLRKEPPMSQEPAPVYQTQPVAAIYQGGSNMRGDQKWPPEEYKRQSEVDNEERRKLAQQPAFRPRRQQKDYADFFAKNALNNTYPGYRAPPGTQHHA